jgi:hypothetical protein
MKVMMCIFWVKYQFLLRQAVYGNNDRPKILFDLQLN